MIDPEFEKWLLSIEGGKCVRAKEITPGMYASIKPLIYHWTLIVGMIGDKLGYVDRYCYQTQDLAEKALDEWDGTGEPTGWHRHPATGRRRPNGNAAEEYIAP